MSELIQRVPKEKHYAILRVGYYSEVVNYGPPDPPYTEHHEYIKYEWVGNQKSLETEIIKLIGENKKPGIDFIVIEVAPVQVQTQVLVNLGQ